MQKLKFLTQEMRKLSALSLFKDRRTDIRLIEGLYTIKSDVQCFIGSKESCMQKVMRNEKVRCLCTIFETDRQTFWLIEGLYAIKRDVLCFIGSKESCMQKKARSRLKKWESDMPLGHFPWQTDIVAYRGVVCNQKGTPRVKWILGRLNAKNQGPK